MGTYMDMTSNHMSETDGMYFNCFSTTCNKPVFLFDLSALDGFGTGITTIISIAAVATENIYMTFYVQPNKLINALITDSMSRSMSHSLFSVFLFLIEI